MVPSSSEVFLQIRGTVGAGQVPCLVKNFGTMDVSERNSHQQLRRQMEEGMWAVLRPFFSRRAEVAAAAGSGLWKV